jgi:inhibin beta
VFQEFDTYTEMSSSVGVRLSSLGWQKLDITRTVGSWYNSGRRERLRLLVDCSGCGKEASPALVEGRSGEKVRPFLVAHTEPGAGRRVRRLALDCSTATKGQCCKESFYVSFQKLGWDDWVIAPKGYYANYCRGDCSRHRTPDTYYHYHGHVIDQVHKVDRLAGLQPCCVPMKFSSTSIIYFGKDNNILKKDLPRMVVDECGCP